MIQQIITIARNTFTECIRQPIFVVLILVGGLAMILNPMLAGYTMEDDNKLLWDLGLSTLFLAGLFLAAFSATGVLATEIENKTVLTVVSKPVSRPVFVMGKYVGVASAIAVAYWILSIVFLLTVRHRVMSTASDQFDKPVWIFGGGLALVAFIVATAGNYLYRWVFTSSLVLWLFSLMSLGFLMVLVLARPQFGLLDTPLTLQPITTEFSEGGSFAGGQIFIALLMIFEAVLILVAIAIAASTRLGQVMTLTICTGAFVLGLISGYIHTHFGDPDRQLLTRVLAKTFYTIVPDMQMLWPADALSQGNNIPLSFLGILSSYAALYIVAILAGAVALFQTREVG
jgi:ABC-type transport system involved in multi-copper enzyme maturation permease subunit